jgi:hypothetical protein
MAKERKASCESASRRWRQMSLVSLLSSLLGLEAMILNVFAIRSRGERTQCCKHFQGDIVQAELFGSKEVLLLNSVHFNFPVLLAESDQVQSKEKMRKHKIEGANRNGKTWIHNVKEWGVEDILIELK